MNVLTNTLMMECFNFYEKKISISNEKRCKIFYNKEKLIIIYKYRLKCQI